jgi:hypothetical protein
MPNNLLQPRQLELHVAPLDIEVLCCKNHQLKHDGSTLYTSYKVVTLTTLHKVDKLQTN